MCSLNQEDIFFFLNQEYHKLQTFRLPRSSISCLSGSNDILKFNPHIFQLTVSLNIALTLMLVLAVWCFSVITINLLIPAWFPSESSVQVLENRFKNTTQDERYHQITGGPEPLTKKQDISSNIFLQKNETKYFGFMQDPASYIYVADHLSLNVTIQELMEAGISETHVAKLVAYLGAHGAMAAKLLETHPLSHTFTYQELKDLCNLYRTFKIKKLKEMYENSNPKTPWYGLHINIRTIIYSCFEDQMFSHDSSLWSEFWSYAISDNVQGMKNLLIGYALESRREEKFIEVVMITAVEKIKCDRLFSINFLVDASQSIGHGPFLEAKKFLSEFYEETTANIPLSSLHFYSSSFEPCVSFGHSRSDFIKEIKNKHYTQGSTYTGEAMRQYLSLIQAQKMADQVLKVFVVLTDGDSHDKERVEVYAPAIRKAGIVTIGIAIGSEAAINQRQLDIIAGSPENKLRFDSYNALTKLQTVISNHICTRETVLQEKIIRKAVSIENGSPNYMTFHRNPESFSLLNITIQQQEEIDPEDMTVYYSELFPNPNNLTGHKATIFVNHTGNSTIVSVVVPPSLLGSGQVHLSIVSTKTLSYQYVLEQGDKVKEFIKTHEQSIVTLKTFKGFFEILEGDELGFAFLSVFCVLATLFFFKFVVLGIIQFIVRRMSIGVRSFKWYEYLAILAPIVFSLALAIFRSSRTQQWLETGNQHFSEAWNQARSGFETIGLFYGKLIRTVSARSRTHLFVQNLLLIYFVSILLRSMCWKNRLVRSLFLVLQIWIFIRIQKSAVLVWGIFLQILLVVLLEVILEYPRDNKYAVVVRRTLIILVVVISSLIGWIFFL